MRLPRLIRSWFLARRVRLFLAARLRPRRARAYARLRFDPLEVRVVPATYTVTNTNDSGSGSFRQAIIDANATPGGDDIAFNIPGAGVHTIAPTSALPTVTDNVFLDATTQPGYAGSPLIELAGYNAGTGTVDGLYLTTGASSSVILGLAINRFARSGIVLNDTQNVVVSDNYIGTDPTGTLDRGNARYGVDVSDGTNNAVARNLISGNDDFGVILTADPLGAVTDHVVTGNRIGTTAAGTAALPNAGGVLVLGAGNAVGFPNEYDRNVISGNAGSGVVVSGAGATGNAVVNNYVGTTADGAAAVPNTSTGIDLVDGASNNTVTGNVVSGNAIHGINLGGAGTTGNVVAGNRVGTDATGAAPVGNANGVTVQGGATANTVGGTTPADRNVIAGNGGWGVLVTGSGTDGNTIAGNYIGTSASGKVALGNGTGVLVSGGAENTTVGGAAAGAGNVISGNSGPGVRVTDGGTTGTVVAGNSVGTNAAGNDQLAHAGTRLWLTGEDTAADAVGDTAPAFVAPVFADGFAYPSGNLIGQGGWQGGTNVPVAGGVVDGQTDPGTGTFDEAYRPLTGLAGSPRLELTFDALAYSATAGGTVRSHNAPVGFGSAAGSLNQAVTWFQDTNGGSTVWLFDARSLTGNPADVIEVNDPAGFDAWRTFGIVVDRANLRVYGTYEFEDGPQQTAPIAVTGAQIDAIDRALVVQDHRDPGTYRGPLVDNLRVTAEAYAAGQVGRAFHFDGVDDYVEVPDGPLVDLTGAMTAEAWVRLDTMAHIHVVVSKRDGSSYPYQLTVLPDGAVRFESDLNLLDTAAGLVTANTWYHLAATRDAGNTVRIYVNGSLVQTGTLPAAVANDAPVRVGTDGISYLEGRVDEVSLYGRALSGSEVSAIHAAGAAGKGLVGNATFGVLIDGGADANTVGGTTAGARNVISGNADAGVWVSGAGTDGNRVVGNYIGTDAAGTAAVANGTGVGAWPAAGVAVVADAQGTVVGTDGDGTDDDAEGNLISGNVGMGVFVGYGTATDGTVIAGNTIGLTAAGTAALANGANGILVFDGAHNTRIGTDGDGTSDLAEMNVISGNVLTGVQLDTTGNVVAGNRIGTNAAGTAALGNATHGVLIVADGANNVIGGAAPGAGNLISGNAGGGVVLSGANVSGNVVAGNRIGTDAAGTAAVGNGWAGGVWIEAGAHGNTVGGTTAGAGNVISGNPTDGVRITGTGTTGNLVAGNYVGVNADGTGLIAGTLAWYKAEGNAANAVGSDPGTLTGAVGYGAGKVGQAFAFSGAGGRVTFGSHFPFNGPGDATVEFWLNGSYTRHESILWTQPNTVDVNRFHFYVFGNSTFGFDYASPSGILHTVVLGPGDGIPLVPNTWSHLAVTRVGNTYQVYVNGALARTVVDNTPDLPTATGWLIGQGSGNLTGSVDELGLYNRALTAAEVAAIHAAGANGKAVGNAQAGVRIDGGAANNTVGGTAAGARNVIGGNAGAGVLVTGNGTDGNTIAGNYIGLAADGTTAAGNAQQGVRITVDASGNTVGGTTAGAGNVVSGNAGHGVEIAAGADGNYVQGNRIGTDAAGALDRGNAGAGVNVVSSAGTVIGGSTAGARNVVSGNDSAGINLATTSGTVVRGNYVGTDATGTADLGNGSGVQMNGSGDVIGGLNPGEGNVISGNDGGAGIWNINTTGVDDNQVLGNYIGVNATGTAPLGNVEEGIELVGATSTRIEGNVIAANTGRGIRLHAAASGTVVRGNRIGTDTTGTLDFGNGSDGVYVESPNNVVGGTTAADRNVISGNSGDGVRVTGAAATGNTVAGNYVGLAADGATALANSGGGVVVSGGAHENSVGAASALLVANADGHGVVRLARPTGALLDTLVAPNGGGLGYASGLAYGPDGKLYVASYDTHSVLRYDPVTGALIDAFVPAGSGGLTGARDLTFGPDGHLYVASGDNGKILRYDGRTGAFLGTFVSEPGTNPLTLEFGPDGRLYVGEYFGSVVRYDGTTGARLGAFGTISAPGPNLHFGSDGKLYVSSYYNHFGIL